MRSVFFGAAVLLAGCSYVGIGTNVSEVTPGQYKIVTTGADDAAVADNQRVAVQKCPKGYTVLGQGDALDKPLNIVFRDSDYAKYLLIQCNEPGVARSGAAGGASAPAKG